MAAFVLSSPYLSITGPGDVSTYLRSITSNHSQAEVDATEATTYGAAPFKERLPGLQDLSLAIVLKDDLADDGVDEDMFALWGTTFAVAWRYHNTTISVTNPEYQATMMLTTESTLGAVGNLAERNFNLVIASGVITRDVTP